MSRKFSIHTGVLFCACLAAVGAATVPATALADNGCSQSGYRWMGTNRDGDIPFYIKTSTAPTAAAVDRIADGATTWNSLNNNCGFNDTSSAVRRYKGSSSIGFNPGDGYSRVDFGSVQNVCGTPVQSCGISSGAGEFDLRFSSGVTWSTIGTGCGQNRDLWSAAAHEFGHTFELDHPAPGNEDLTMQPAGDDGSPGVCRRRSLGRGDVLGFRAFQN